jgi:SAM-dependent methyltransferase
MLPNMMRLAAGLSLFASLMAFDLGTSGTPGTLGTLGTLDTQAPKRPDAPQLAPYVPTPQEVVDRMLLLAKVQKGDFVVDLGCGDGRIVVSAAKTYGARGLGVDIDPVRIEEANANAKAAGVTHLVEFKLQDALKTDVSNATVVTTYLLSQSNLKVRPLITKQLKPGSRIVTHSFSMGDWTPTKTETFPDETGRQRTIYLYLADGKVRQ